jgi:hypothetical protein
VIVQTVRSINTMAGITSYVVAVASDMEHYHQVTSALAVDRKEVCYVYSAGTRNGNSTVLCVHYLSNNNGAFLLQTL